MSSTTTTSTPTSKLPHPHSHKAPLTTYPSLLTPPLMRPLAKVVKMESWEVVRDMLGGLWLFQQEHMGMERPHQVTEMKLPASIFSDFRPNGPQRWILQAIKTFARTHQWPKHQYPFASNVNETMTLFTDIKQRLRTREYLHVKYVYLGNLSDEATRTEAREMLSHMQDVQEVEHLVQATHIVCDDPTGENALNLDAGYLRTLDRKEELCFVHWWYYPDSYEQWVEKDLVAGTDPEPPVVRPKWMVYFSWLKHSQLFNEFMNPIDYELDEDNIYEKLEEDIQREIEQNPSILGGAPSTQGGASGAPGPAAGTGELVSPFGDASKKRKREEGVSGTENGDDGQQQKRARLSQGTTVGAEQVSAELMFGSNVTVNLPETCKWFSCDEVDEREKREFPEFFNESDPMKNPTIYKRYRNFIVRQFHINPQTYLTATECRRVLVGDVTVIMRLHAFLEHHSIINAGLTSGNTTTKVLGNVLNQDFVSSGPGNTLVTFSAQGRGDAATTTSEQAGTPAINTTDTLNTWTQEENLRLLDGISRYGDNWNAVSGFVGTKNAHDCMKHFAQLPIEEEFLRESTDVSRANGSSQHAIPFADTSNPVMATVTFLASMVSPGVAAASARAASEALDKELKEGPQKDAKFDMSQLDMKTAAAVALGSATARAKHIAEREELEIQALSRQILDRQMKKFDLKMAYMDKMIESLERERLNVELERQRLRGLDNGEQ
uniref:SWIRM domain-containing protein n=1 Tax=Percolomonas cosmopolitus TaxID=63605 RepID=A0A7S1PGU9_9EUKA|eukprot:CAMPEP_0117438702 /NCGR_PEP_ID=MMETSP0759-20121206/2189_1 /TAXON_ID=63605 /ORGANISM="Percolomonas cosmopolitus, Strain WS" /LENGTH=720 /DNA_ID=CAMNT_0005230401 /DNA_START=18 /DNA_END=2180 /DNA_ORIENTATION=-